MTVSSSSDGGSRGVRYRRNSIGMQLDMQTHSLYGREQELKFLNQLLIQQEEGSSTKIGLVHGVSGT